MLIFQGQTSLFSTTVLVYCMHTFPCNDARDNILEVTVEEGKILERNQRLNEKTSP